MRIALLLIFLAACTAQQSSTCPFIEDSHVVSRVIDGDTVCLRDGSYIRLIGIDSPERGEKGYQDSTLFLEDLVYGKEVRVEYQKERKDKYKRDLADLFLGEKHVNIMIVEEGWATAFPYPPNTKYAKAIAEAEKEAKSGGRGIWPA